MDLNGYVEKLARGAWDPPRALVYGEENLGVGEALARIAAAVEKSGANRITLDGKKLDAAALGDRIAQMPLFAVRRFLVVEGVAPRGEGMVELLDRVAAEEDLFLLVRHRGDLDKRLRWYKRFTSEGAVFRFEAVKEREMPDRIRKQARALGLDLPIEGAQAIAARVGTDLMTARNELEKLRLYVAPREKIGAGDVEAVVGRSRETIVYEITEGISTRDRARSLADLKDLLRQGVSAGAILSLLAREVRFLLQAKITLGDVPLLRKALGSYGSFTSFFRDRLPDERKNRFGKGRGNLLRQHPYVVFLRLRQASRFETDELAGLLAAFSRADRRVKRGGGSPETILSAAVAAASSPPGRRS